MARKRIVEMFGEDAVNDGYKVYTTIVDKNQVAANHALREALMEYDERHGYRGPESHYDLTPESNPDDVEKFLDTFSIIGDMRPAIITSIMDTSVIAEVSGIGRVEIPWAGISWARKYINENRRGAEPETAYDVLKTGDIVRVIPYHPRAGRLLLPM